MMPLCLRSNNVYKFSCGRCNATYYGKTCRHFNVKVNLMLILILMVNTQLSHL